MDIKELNEQMLKALKEAEDISFERVNNNGIVSDYVDNKKITPRDILDAKQEYEETIKELTGAIQKISVYGTNGQRLNAWKLATNTIKEILPRYGELYNETVGED